MSELAYRGYIGSAEVDVDGATLHGRLLFIRDVITYSAATVPELQAAFRAAVDDYLATCEQYGDEPDKPCRGSFNVRVGPERHLAIARAARAAGVKLNEFVTQAIDGHLGRAR